MRPSIISTVPRIISILWLMALSSAASRALSVDHISISMASTHSAPHFSAAIESTPVPQPTSKALPTDSNSRIWRHIMRVVWWWPEPNDILGVTITSIVAGSVGAGWWGARITMRPSMSTLSKLSASHVEFQFSSSISCSLRSSPNSAIASSASSRHAAHSSMRR